MEAPNFHQTITYGSYCEDARERDRDREKEKENNKERKEESVNVKSLNKRIKNKQ